MMTGRCHADWSRTSINNGYLIVHCPNHPRAWSTGYIYAHILIAEEKIGRLLSSNEVVHHIDEDKLNNDPANIIVTTPSEHARKHSRKPVMIILTCEECGGEFIRRFNQRAEVKGYKHTFCSRSCSAKYHWRIRKRPRIPSVS